MRRVKGAYWPAPALNRMIDTHCHLLHDLDDGPKTVADAVRLARSLVAAGVGTAVCTPHYSRRYPTSQEVAEERLHELEAAVRADELPLELRLAAEVSPTFALAAALAELRTRAVADRFLIIEVQPDTPATFFETVTSRLAEAELTPVFAHPERCRAARRRPRLLGEAREGGSLLQVVAPSLTGRWGDDIAALAWKLLERGQADLVGSDAHGHRRPGADFHEALMLVGSRLGWELAAAVTATTPTLVLEGTHPRELGPATRA